MQTQKVVFMNKDLSLRLAGLLRLPGDFGLNNDYPAVVVVGSMLSIKEQVQSTYAKRLTEQGYVSLVFDDEAKAKGHPGSRNCRALRNPTLKGRLIS
ncbi:hypothetical protein [Limosilactobacillus sp.]|uniref:hypothetical protein n=1 Tax=Limosilactobacillus sp. TaxID=2773925 RepID=UPI003F0B8689